MKFAYFGYPHIGGTYTVFRHLRSGLKKYNISVEWLGLGLNAYKSFNKARWNTELPYGRIIGEKISNGKELTEIFCNSLIEKNYDGVFVNVLADKVQTNAIRYLPRKIRRIMIVHSITPATYDAAHCIRNYVHATVGVSPRIRHDLIYKKKFSAENTFFIPNCIDLSKYCRQKTNQSPNSPIRIIYVGRIEDYSKGIFWIPKILSHIIHKCDFKMSIIGDGPDLHKLMEKCCRLSHCIDFYGRVDSSKLPTLLSQHDIFLFPSRFEGLPLSLIEAQSAGCIPISSKITGVTDYLIKHKKTGYLFEIGNCMQAAKYILELSRNRELIQSMSNNIRTINNKFTIETMSKMYSHLINDTFSLEPPFKPLSMDSWTMAKKLEPSFRTYLPVPMKNYLRKILEKLK